MAAENVQTFTDGNFDETIGGGKPVLVDFWAEWCGPCKRLAPTVDALAGDYAGKVAVGKLNVDENPNTAFKFRSAASRRCCSSRAARWSSRSSGCAKGRPQEGHRQARGVNGRSDSASLPAVNVHPQRHHHRLGPGRA